MKHCLHLRCWPYLFICFLWKPAFSQNDAIWSNVQHCCGLRNWHSRSECGARALAPSTIINIFFLLEFHLNRLCCVSLSHHLRNINIPGSDMSVNQNHKTLSVYSSRSLISAACQPGDKHLLQAKHSSQGCCGGGGEMPGLQSVSTTQLEKQSGLFFLCSSPPGSLFIIAISISLYHLSLSLFLSQSELCTASSIGLAHLWVIFNSAANFSADYFSAPHTHLGCMREKHQY